MTDQLRFHFDKPAELVRGELLHFPVQRMAGRARREARAVFQRPAAKRRWHMEQYVDRVRLDFLIDSNGFEFAERQARIYRQMLIDEIDRLVVLDYLFGSDDEARSA